MPLLRDKPIQSKLRAIVLLVSVLAVAGSCAVFVGYQWFSSRTRLARRLGIMAEIVGDQSTAALEFNQPVQAAALLKSLKAERQIVAAAIYARDGRRFAAFLRDGAGDDLIRPDPGPDGSSFEGGELFVFQPMRSGGERVGTIHLRSDLADLWQRLLVTIGTSMLVLLGASAAALYLSSRLGGLVTGPVQRLDEAVQAVSKSRDFSRRVESGGHDELGRLIAGFNDMLSQIQVRDAALAAAREDLENRVKDRTRELESEVTERKAAEARLKEQDARLTEAQEIARMGSWEWTLSTHQVSWTDEVYRLFGLMPGRFGGGFSDFVQAAHPEDRAALRSSLEASVSSREPLSVDFRIIRPDGAVRFLHTQGKPILDDAGRPIRLLGTMQDVTERALADRAIQALNRELQDRMSDLAAVNKELEGFSYSVSHDLRAPLRSIDGYSKMLIEDCSDKLDSEGRRYLGVILNNTRRMGHLIDDLLAFSRMGRQSLEASPIDMEELARQVAAEQVESNRDRALDVRVGSMPPSHGDRAMFRQVFVNLISNAIKYSKGRTPAVIEIGARIEPGETVYWIRDNGVGFDMLYSNKLFGVFQRLHSPQEFEGTGVGLALVQRIVQRHGGRVWAEGKVNEGATFYFAQPHRPAPAPVQSGSVAAG